MLYLCPMLISVTSPVQRRSSTKLSHRRHSWPWSMLLALLSIITLEGASAQERFTNQSRVQINGVGAIRVGMTVTEAERAAGIALVNRSQVFTDNDRCYYVEPEDNSISMSFMVTGGTIARVDIGPDSDVVTLSGVGIGDTEQHIFDLFPYQIHSRPHPYGQGQYLEFVPRDGADQNHRVIFETSAAGRVMAYRAGQLPEVNYIEGCS